MPSGTPKDPIAYAEKQAAAKAKRDAAKAANGGIPVKRVAKTRKSVPNELDSRDKTLADLATKLGESVLRIKANELELEQCTERLVELEVDYVNMKRRSELAENRLMAVLDMLSKINS